MSSVRIALAAFAVASLFAGATHAETQLPESPDLSAPARQAVVTVVRGSAVGAVDSPTYGIRADLPQTGSNIRRNLVTGWLPFDKRYDELTEEQRAQFRGEYQRLGPRDEPPFPAKGLGTIYRGISVAQTIFKAKGKLAMRVQIDSHGEPLSVSVIESPDPAVTRAVAGILMREKYKPGLCDGTPCTMDFAVRAILDLQ